MNRGTLDVVRGLVRLQGGREKEGNSLRSYRMERRTKEGSSWSCGGILVRVLRWSPLDASHSEGGTESQRMQLPTPGAPSNCVAAPFLHNLSLSSMNPRPPSTTPLTASPTSH